MKRIYCGNIMDMIEQTEQNAKEDYERSEHSVLWDEKCDHYKCKKKAEFVWSPNILQMLFAEISMQSPSPFTPKYCAKHYREDKSWLKSGFRKIGV